MTPTLGCHPRGEDRASTQGASTGVQLLSCELGASQPASSPGRSSGCLGSVAPFFLECPPPLPAPAGSVPGAMLPGGSPQHPGRRCRCLGGCKSARRSPTSVLAIGSGAPRPAHWRCRCRPPLHKAPLGRAGPVGDRRAAEPPAGGEAGAAGCAPAAAEAPGSPPGP